MPTIRETRSIRTWLWTLLSALLAPHGVFAFDVNRAEVVNAYIGEATAAKRAVALEGVAALLEVREEIAGYGSADAISGGFHLSNFAVTGFVVGPRPGDTPAVGVTTTIDATSDADFTPFGDPLALDGALINVLADFTSARDVDVASGGAIIDTAGFQLELTGDLDVDGFLVKRGDGTLRLTGNNAWQRIPVAASGGFVVSTPPPSGSHAPLFLGEGTISGTTTSLATDIETTRVSVVDSEAPPVIAFDQTFDGAYAFHINGDYPTVNNRSVDLVKAGAGSVTLTRKNRMFRGATTITGGTLALADEGTIGTGALWIDTGATFDIAALTATNTTLPGAIGGAGAIHLGVRNLRTEPLAATTFGGVISGTGAVQIVGDNDPVFTITEAQTYSGGTVIADATLKLAGAGALHASGAVLLDDTQAVLDITTADAERTIGALSGVGHVYLGANGLRIGAGNATTTFAGRFHGDGDVTKVGTGTLTLTGNMPHAGTTRIEAGRVRTPTNGISHRIVNDAILEFVQDDEGSLPLSAYDGAISGSGELRKSGGGAVWLRGTNTYTGGTVVEDGVLLGNTDSLQGAILTQNAVAFYQVVDGTYAGAVRGDGSLFVFGPGRVALTGDNRALTGGVLFTGHLAAGHAMNLGPAGGDLGFAGGRLDLLGDITSPHRVFVTADGGTIDTAGHRFQLFGGLAGNGRLRKIGTGQFELRGLNPNFNGTLELARGRARLDGTLGGNLHVADGVVLDVAATPARIESVRLTGETSMATIEGGTVAVSAAPGDYASRQRYTLIDTTGGVHGVFDAVDIDGEGLGATLSYTPTAVLLTLAQNDVALATFGQTFAQRETGAVLNAFLQPRGANGIGEAYDALAALVDDELPLALESISGTSLAGVNRVLGQQSRAFNSLVTQRVAGLGSTTTAYRGGGSALLAGAALLFGMDPHALTTRHGAWLKGFGGAGNTDVSNGADDQSLQFGGFAAGYDIAWTPAVTLGLLATFSETSLEQSRPVAATDIESWSLGAYGRWRGAATYVDGMFSYTRHNFKSSRRLALGPNSHDLSAAFDGDTWNVRGETGYRFGSATILEPFAAIQYARHDAEAYRERGGALALAVDDHTETSIRSQLGVRLHVPIPTNTTLDVRSYVYGAWSHEFTDEATLGAHFAADPAALNLSVRGIEPADDAASFGAGVSLHRGERTAITVGFDAEVDGRQHVFGAFAGVRLRF